MQSAVVKKWLLATMLAFSATSVMADRQVVIETVSIEQIIADVVGYTAQRATNELITLANINTEQRGYTERYSYSSQQNYRGKPPALDRDSREELRELRQDHQRKLAKLERELDKNLRELSRDFAQDARDRRKLAKKREKFQYKVDKAYYKFSEKVDKANDQFDQKRDKILRNAWAYNGRYNH